MRLLILTQTVDENDPVLGFFHQWIEEFARNCERVYVICLFAGKHALPSNVTVLSLGKEKGKGERRTIARSAIVRLQYVYRFFSYIWKYRHDYDAVFVHMNQIYVILGAAFWRLWGKHVCLWYAHGAVSFSLRFAEIGAHTIATSTAEGFRLPSKKVHIVGQGIDAKQFVQCTRDYRSDVIRIVYVGRISPVKRCEVLIEAAGLLHARGEHFTVTFVGDISAPKTQTYYTSLLERIHTLGIEEQVTFVGGIPHDELAQYLCSADVFANPSQTGSLDKAGLEAILSGVPVITSNVAYTSVLGAYADRLMFPPAEASALADRIVALHRAPDRIEIINTLIEKVKNEHSLEGLIPRIFDILTTIQ